MHGLDSTMLQLIHKHNENSSLKTTGTVVSPVGQTWCQDDSLYLMFLCHTRLASQACLLEAGC